MTGKDSRPDDAGPSKGSVQDLRRQAEQIAREKTTQSPDDLETLSPEQIRQTLHELRVHQIELEMQNEELRRAQAELDASRARYFDLYDLAPVGYFSVSEKGLILEANLTSAILLGVSRSELCKQPLTGFILKEDQDIYYRHHKHLFKTHATSSGQAEGAQVCELRMVKKQGAPFWVRLEATAAEEADGAPVQRIVLSDITEHKFQEDERELTARLIVLVSTPGDFRERMVDLTASLQNWSGCEAVGIRLRAGDDYPYYETRGFPPAFVQMENHLCTYDRDGEILRDEVGNPVLECMCGNILRGRFDSTKPFFTAHGSFWSNNTTALLAGTTEADRQARTRNRCNGEGYESVALIPLRTGQQVFGLLQFNDRRPNRFTPDLIAHLEKMADSLAIALSQRQADEALRGSEANFKAMFETASIGVAQADPKTGQWLRVNQKMCEITGYSSAEMLTMRVAEITHPEDREKDWAAFQDVVNGKAKNYRIEKRYVRKDGTIIWVNLNMTVIRDISDQPTRTVATIEDITERKRAEEEKQKLEAQLRQAQKMEAVGALAGGIAHEFNNVLGIILGNAELAKDDIPEWNPARFNLDEIKAASLRAKEVVRQLLTFSRKKEEHRQPINLASLTKDAIRFLRSSIPTSIEIRQNIAEGCHTIIADPTQIHQVILNLSTNAAHAMEETGGILEFSLQDIALDETSHGSDSKLQPGEHVMLQVSDTGSGIPAEILDRIFDPYFTTKEVGKGTGMGLSVVHGIVEVHGGSIEVESNPGDGATFKIFFPATKEESSSAVEMEVKLPSGTERILFIDDEQSIAKLGQLMLEKLGYQVQSETNPSKALELFASNPERFDLIITDTTMPRMTGDQLIKEILTIRPDMKTILCTGYSERVDEESARTIGARAHALKPLDRKLLAMIVRKVLDERT